MTTKHSLSGFWLALAGLIFAGFAPAPSDGTAAAQETRKPASVSQSGTLLRVLNPAVASKMAERLPLSPRLSTIEAKTIYMVDINWGGPEASLSVFEEIQAWFAKNMPSVKTVIKIKRGGYDADDPALWKEISDSKGDGVIVGISA